MTEAMPALGGSVEILDEAVRSAVAELDRQVERGSFFAQAVFQRTTLRLSEVEAIVTRLIDVLAARGFVDPQEMGLQAPQPGDERPADEGGGERPAESPRSTISWPTVTIRVDDPHGPAEPAVAVDCDARMAICRAVCCKLAFPLSAEEVEVGTVKWDIGHPYVVRQESSGYCTHNDTTSGRCRVYAERPGICRRYSCAQDSRIWKNFDDMVLNQEWLDEHLGARDIHLEGILPSMDIPVTITTKPVRDRNENGS